MGLTKFLRQPPVSQCYANITKKVNPMDSTYNTLLEIPSFVLAWAWLNTNAEKHKFHLSPVLINVLQFALSCSWKNNNQKSVKSFYLTNKIYTKIKVWSINKENGDIVYFERTKTCFNFLINYIQCKSQEMEKTSLFVNLIEVLRWQH